MEITFLGSGDAFGSGGRYHTCFCVTTAAERFLVDCGASSLIAMRRFGVDPNTVDRILVTHLHGDHFGGLPFLLLDAQLVSRRTRPLTIAGPPGLIERLAIAREAFFPGSTASEPRYELRIVEIEAGRTHVLGATQVTPFEVKHFSGAPPFALRIEAEGRVLTYSGDTEWVEALVEAARGADLFVCEAYFFDKKVKYHLDWATLRSRLAEIGAKRVVLTHMSSELLGRLAEVACETAEDGKTLRL